LLPGDQRLSRHGGAAGRGIETERLEAKGYGETDHIYSDADIAKLKKEEEKEAAHQKNRRTAFIVIKEGKIMMKSTNSK